MRGRMTAACRISPVSTVTMYMPSISPTLAGSSSDRILPVIRNMMPMGEYLQRWESCISDIFCCCWQFCGGGGGGGLCFWHLFFFGQFCWVVQRQDLARDQEHDADGGVPAMVGVLYFGHFLLFLTVLFGGGGGGDSCVSDIFCCCWQFCRVVQRQDLVRDQEHDVDGSPVFLTGFFELVIAGSSSNTILKEKTHHQQRAFGIKHLPLKL